MVPIEQKDWTEEDRASKLGQNHPLDSTKRRYFVPPHMPIYFASVRSRRQALLRVTNEWPLVAPVNSGAGKRLVMRC